MMDTEQLNQFRPIPFYFLNSTEPADLTQEAINLAMQQVRAAGYGGIVLFNKPPDGFDKEGYLSDFWFEVTHRFILAARAEQLALWINDGFNYPPGEAGGRILQRNPELQQMRLRPNPDGRLEVVTVPWGFPAFEEPESSRLFIEIVYEEYFRRFQEYFGNGISGFFSDADNRRVDAGTAHKLSGEKFYPWSRNFSAAFANRFGYTLETRLRGLFTGTDQTVLRDYWRLAGELYQQWFRNNFRWCQEHNLKYTFHTSDTGPLEFKDCYRSSAFSEGAPLELLQHADFPGTDHEIAVLDGGTHYDARLFHPAVTLGGGMERSQHPSFYHTATDLRAKYAASAAYLYRRPRVMCEMFAATNWGATYEELRKIATWQILQGVNFIVPHAVHHRLHRSTKFFAPPEFRHSLLRHGLRQFNDWLARCCQAAAQGEYPAEIAVPDPTEQVWQGHSSAPFFRLCDRLNRSGLNYVICDQKHAGQFPHLLDPEQPEQPLPAPGFDFSGGELAAMHRRLPDGSEVLLLGNVWSEQTLRGQLTFKGSSYELELASGEIAILGGPQENYRRPVKALLRRTLDAALPVVWDEPNCIPFEQQLSFRRSSALGLRLLVPAELSAAVFLSGEKLCGGRPERVFADEYVSFALPPECGETHISLNTAASFATPCLLTGDFDLELQTFADYHCRCMSSYMLDMYAPARAEFTLKPRRQTLDPTCGWEVQGQVFYSGKVSYDLGPQEILPGDELWLPAISGIAELEADGRCIGQRIFSPWRFPLGELQGPVHLKLHCYNTMANRLERYAKPSGLLGAPQIVAVAPDC
jgi:hypothetical protein